MASRLLPEAPGNSGLGTEISQVQGEFRAMGWEAHLLLTLIKTYMRITYNLKTKWSQKSHVH